MAVVNETGGVLSSKSSLNSIEVSTDALSLDTHKGGSLGSTSLLNSIELSVGDFEPLETHKGGVLTTIENFLAIKDASGSRKTFDPIKKEWKTLSSNIENKGMTNLSNLIQNTTKQVKLNEKTTLTSGVQFSEPINLKSFKKIDNISIF
jgi:hypothetical protein